ncbi:prepilin-type N-terminal cleavage/methylation domain-containing protein [Candidatus Daviesbacteria bacterium]|nr:prepilin-type N-terminal cleavage/methylation domain-containing protein [Candidatus Daviesbacteria bacterium]
MSNFKRYLREKGFSIIEILLVVMIVGFITSLVLLLPSSIGLVGDSKSTALAKDIASRQMESLRAKGYDNLLGLRGPATNISDSRVSQLQSGSATFTISDCPIDICTNNEQIVKAIVAVNWKEKNQTKTVSLSTLIAKGGLQ